MRPKEFWRSTCISQWFTKTERLKAPLALILILSLILVLICKRTKQRGSLLSLAEGRRISGRGSYPKMLDVLGAVLLVFLKIFLAGAAAPVFVRDQCHVCWPLNNDMLLASSAAINVEPSSPNLVLMSSHLRTFLNCWCFRNIFHVILLVTNWFSLTINY